MVTTIYTLVTVRVSPFSILAHLIFTPQTKPSNFLTFYMFHTSQNNFFLFKNFVSITMFILNFTLLFLFSRTSLHTLSFSRAPVKTVSTPSIFSHSSPSPSLLRRSPSQPPAPPLTHGIDVSGILIKVFYNLCFPLFLFL